MNSLLGSADDPRTAGLLGLGLRLMSTPGRFGQAFGSAGLGALGDMRQAQAAQEQKKRAALHDQLLAMQLAQAKQAAERKAKDDAVLAESFKPLQGPMPDGAAGVTPRFDLPGMMSRGLSMDGVPEALKLNAALNPAKKAPIKGSPGDVFLDPETYKPLASVPKEDSAPSDWKLYQLSGAPQRGVSFDQWDLARKRAAASNTQVSYGTPVQGIDASGNPVFIQPTKDGSPANIIPGVRPPKSAAEERAEAEKATRERQGKQMLSVMDDAKAILQGGKATASGLGTMVDAGARVIGKTTVGAQDAARLQALSGWLVANVPRMEGPQSNYDVQNYMTMAGKVGDSTVPIPERLAALGEVEKLQRKYSEMNGTPIPAAKTVVRTGTLNGRKVVQYSDGSTDYAD